MREYKANRKCSVRSILCWLIGCNTLLHASHPCHLPPGLRPYHFESEVVARSARSWSTPWLESITCYKRGCASGVTHNGTELEIEDTNFNSSRVLWIHLPSWKEGKYNEDIRICVGKVMPDGAAQSPRQTRSYRRSKVQNGRQNDRKACTKTSFWALTNKNIIIYLCRLHKDRDVDNLMDATTSKTNYLKVWGNRYLVGPCLFQPNRKVLNWLFRQAGFIRAVKYINSIKKRAIKLQQRIHFWPLVLMFLALFIIMEPFNNIVLQGYGSYSSKHRYDAAVMYRCTTNPSFQNKLRTAGLKQNIGETNGKWETCNDK